MKYTTPAFEAAFFKRYPSCAYLIYNMRQALNVPHVSWRHLTRLNLNAVRDHLLLTHAPNTVRTLLATLAAFLRLYSDEVTLPCRDFASVLKVKRVPSQHVALTEDELLRIEQYTPANPTEADTKILAMREALCGARGSDCARLTTSNIDGTFLTYVSQKTKTQTTVPLHHLLAKYLTLQPSASHARSTLNRTLRLICQKVGITSPCTVFVAGRSVTKPKYQLVSFHTMRRTFCTILALRGVPIELIRLYAGHSSQSMTQRYIIGSPTTPCAAANAFFSPQADPVETAPAMA